MEYRARRGEEVMVDTAAFCEITLRKDFIAQNLIQKLGRKDRRTR